MKALLIVLISLFTGCTAVRTEVIVTYVKEPLEISIHLTK